MLDGVGDQCLCWQTTICEQDLVVTVVLIVAYGHVLLADEARCT